MSTRRERILQALEIGPLWRLRTPARQDGASEDAGSAGLDTEQALGESAAMQGQQTASANIPSAIESRSQDESPRFVDDDRATRITQMDWPALKAAVAQCTACGLCKTRTNTVFGVGAERADWMLIGEAPGAEEDLRGEPFVGQAGRLLDSMLAAIGLKRGENVYIANVLKCRPPRNRDPEPFEAEQCTHYLVRQIALVRPKLIVALGRVAAQSLLESNASIASMRGRRFRYQGVPLMVTYHPAYLLRNLADKAKAWEDLVFACRNMRELAGKD